MSFKAFQWIPTGPKDPITVSHKTKFMSLLKWKHVSYITLYRTENDTTIVEYWIALTQFSNVKLGFTFEKKDRE